MTEPTLKDITNTFIEVLTKKVTDLKHPVIQGERFYSGGCALVQIDRMDDLCKIAASFPDNSLSVIVIDRYTGNESLRIEKGEDGRFLFDPNEDVKGIANAINLYIRQGETSTWIFSRHITPLGFIVKEKDDRLLTDEDDDNYDDDSEEDQNDPDLDDPMVSIRGFEVAKEKGFGVLRNQQQRNNFSAELAKRKNWEKQDKYFIQYVALFAKDYYDYGILPYRARTLVDLGKTLAEAAKMLGHTKDRIEKALALPISDSINEMIVKYGIEDE